MQASNSLTKKKPLPKPWLRIISILLIFAFLLMCIFYESLLLGYGNFLNVGRPLNHSVDAVLVLGGDITTRPFVAIQVFKAKFAGRLLYCGVADLKDQGRMAQGTEDNILLKIFDHSGLADIPRINIGDNVNSTIDEAKALAAYLQDHPQEKVAVITNNYHTRRARRIFLHQCRDYKEQLFFVSAPADFYDPLNWWTSTEGRLYYCFEGVKLLTTLLPGGMD